MFVCCQGEQLMLKLQHNLVAVLSILATIKDKQLAYHIASYEQTSHFLVL